MAYKLKTRTMFPALVSVGSPLTLVKTGLSYVLGFDSAAAAEDIAGLITAESIGAVNTVTNQIFTATDTYMRSTGMLYCIVEAIGGGAGGGGVNSSTTTGVLGGGGGGSGGYSRSVITAASIGASQAVTIGAGGAGGAVGSNNGVAGGDTSLGVLVVAKGGSPGTFALSATNAGVGGAGGVAGTGDLAAVGTAGQAGAYSTGGVVYFPSGRGAGSVLGGGGLSGFGIGAVTNGSAATGYGGGGGGGNSGAIATGSSGGAGKAGIIIITEFCSQ